MTAAKMMMAITLVGAAAAAASSVEQTEFTVTHSTSASDLPPIATKLFAETFGVRKLQATTDHLTFYNLYTNPVGFCWVWASCPSCAQSTPVETLYGDVEVKDFDASSYGPNITIWLYVATGSPTPCSGLTSSAALAQQDFVLHQNGVNIFGVGVGGSSGGLAWNIHRNPENSGNHTMWFVNDFHDYPACDFYIRDSIGTERSVSTDLPSYSQAYGTPFECDIYAIIADFGVRCGADDYLLPVDFTKICVDASFEVVAHGNYSDTSTYPLTLTYVPGKECALADSCAAVLGGTASPTPYSSGAATPPPTGGTACTDEGTDETVTWCTAYITKYGG